MTQELGETTNEMMKADDLEVQEILNKRPHGHYWIVIHHRQTKMRMDTGEQVIMRIVKAYDKKPSNLLGTVILEVRDGEIIDTAVNLHDAPINWEPIVKHAGLIENPYVQQRQDIAKDYVYNI